VESLAGLSLSYLRAPLKPAKEGEEAQMSFQRSQVAGFTNIPEELEAKIRENF
jgi:hypothetical protein